MATGPTYSPSPLVTTTYYVSVSGTGICENAINTRQAVTVTVNPLAIASDITAAGSTICAGQSASLTASSAVPSPVFTWYTDQTTTTALATGATYSPSPATTTTYYVSVSGTGICENAINTRQAVTVTVNPLAVASDIDAEIADPILCFGSSTSITATSSISNPIFNWYSDPDLTVLVFTGSNFITPELTINTSYYVTVQSPEFCENIAGTGAVANISVIPCSDLALSKTANNITPIIGDVVNFTVTLNNFGPNDASDISVKDLLPSGFTFVNADAGGTLSGNTIIWTGIQILAGEQISLNYSAIVNSPTGTADEYKNTAEVMASNNFDPNSTPNNNIETENDQDSITLIPIQLLPDITLFKDGSFSASDDLNGNGFPEVNETVTYNFVVQNTGNIKLENVTINDPVIGIINLNVIPNVLDPGESGTATAIYTITDHDINNGAIYNTAIAQGTTPPLPDNPTGITVTAESTDPTPTQPDDIYYDPTCPDCTIIPLISNPKIAVVKEISSFSGDLNNVKIGDVINYVFKVSNIGNTVLSDITINDPLPGLSPLILDPVNIFDNTGDLNSDGLLDLEETWIYRAHYTITKNDINNGKVVNQAEVSGVGPITPEDPEGKKVDDLSDKTSPTNEDNDPTVFDIIGCQIIVHNAFSPNGDNLNDVFKIDGIECYPNNSVEIYNRWGVEVFHIDGYNNNSNAFKGYSNGRTVINESAGLPTGTYFYIIKYLDSDNKQQSSAGYLYLSNNQ